MNCSPYAPNRISRCDGSFRRRATHLGTRVEVQPSPVGEQDQVGANVAIDLVLLRARSDRQCPQQDPANPNLGPHLDVDAPDPRVERSAHKVVVHDVARHPVPLARDIDDRRECEPRNRRHREERTVEVDNLGEVEHAAEMERGDNCDGRVEGGVGVAVVFECTAAEGRDGKSHLLVPGHGEGEEELKEDQGEVESRGGASGGSVLWEPGQSEICPGEDKRTL